MFQAKSLFLYVAPVVLKLYRPGWSQVLGLQACTTTAWLHAMFFNCDFSCQSLQAENQLAYWENCKLQIVELEIKRETIPMKQASAMFAQPNSIHSSWNLFLREL